MERIILYFTAFWLTAGTAFAQFENAPPAFDYNHAKAVPIDISTVHINYEFNVEKKVVNATSTVRFRAQNNGFPFFDIKANLQSVALDGRAVNAALVSSPENATTLRVLDEAVVGGEEHEMTLTFQLLAADVTFADNAAKCGFFMSDLDSSVLGMHYFERYGPANLEFDQMTFSFDVRVTGTDVDHSIYTNGDFNKIEKNHWAVEFPDYFTASSIYFHITNSGAFFTSEGVYKGKERDIPVLVYAPKKETADAGLASTFKDLTELEGTFGPTLHKKYVVYVTGTTSGGMEHAGATVTSASALSHEISHSWFARGMMPANGNSGWIDEAIAKWRDGGYKSVDLQLYTKNLGGFSPYRRSTTEAAYSDGMNLIQGLNRRFENRGGMKPLLADWYAEVKGHPTTTEAFKAFLENETSDNLTEIFRRRVYGRSSIHDVKVPDWAVDDGETHPRPFTDEQYKALR